MLSFRSQVCRNCPVLYYYLYRSITTNGFPSLFPPKRKPNNGQTFLLGNFSSAIFLAPPFDLVSSSIESMRPVKSLVCRLPAMSEQPANRIRQAIVKILGVVSRGPSNRTFLFSIQIFCSLASELVAIRSEFKKLAQEKFSHANRFEKFCSSNFFVRSDWSRWSSVRVGRAVEWSTPGSFPQRF